MPRVVPSQVVSLIDHMFPQYRPGTSNRSLTYNQVWERCYGLRAILDLTDQIGSTLIVLSAHDYSVLVSSIAAIRNVMENPKKYGAGFSVELGPI